MSERRRPASFLWLAALFGPTPPGVHQLALGALIMWGDFHSGGRVGGSMSGIYQRLGPRSHPTTSLAQYAFFILSCTLFASF